MRRASQNSMTHPTAVSRIVGVLRGGARRGMPLTIEEIAQEARLRPTNASARMADVRAAGHRVIVALVRGTGYCYLLVEGAAGAGKDGSDGTR